MDEFLGVAGEGAHGAVFSGVAYSALPLVIETETEEQASEELSAFIAWFARVADETRPPYAVRPAGDNREKLRALEVAADALREQIEAEDG